LPRGDEDIAPGLTEPVRAAVGQAVEALHALVPALLADPRATPALARPEESAGPAAAGLPHPAATGAEDR
jgi:hydrogenase maturation protease